MKKAIWFAAALLAVLAPILVANALTLSSRQIEVAAVEAIAVDGAAAARERYYVDILD